MKMIKLVSIVVNALVATGVLTSVVAGKVNSDVTVPTAAHKEFRPVSVSSEERWCLVENIFHEARNQGEVEWKAIMAVTINRASDARWSSNICKVVYAKKQFSWTINIKQARKAFGTKAEFAKLVEISNKVDNWLANGFETDLADANHYATFKTNKAWMASMALVGNGTAHKYFKG
jgi:spore germination cell wall hydrolase CwlJ-like protein